MIVVVCYVYWPIARYCFFLHVLLFCLFISSLCKLLPYLVNKDVYIWRFPRKIIANSGLERFRLLCHTNKVTDRDGHSIYRSGINGTSDLDGDLENRVKVNG